MNLTTEQLAITMEEWVAEVVPGFSRYEHMPTELAKALPMVIGEVVGDEVREGNRDVPNLGPYQQLLVRTRRVTLLLLVPPEPSWTASQALYSAVDLLGAALRRDPTLGGRVKEASKFYEASYTPPELQHADGTRARQATLTVTVGEQVEEYK
jgi:hypothetical protein